MEGEVRIRIFTGIGKITWCFDDGFVFLKWAVWFFDEFLVF